MAEACAQVIADGLNSDKRPIQITNAVSGQIKLHSRAASALASYSVVKAFNDALLDELRRQGVTQVGVVPEHPRHEVTDAPRKVPQPQEKGTGKFRSFKKAASGRVLRRTGPPIRRAGRPTLLKGRA